MLTYSAEDYLNDNWDAPQNILQWGRRYVRNNIDDLRSKCGDGTANATAFWGLFVDDRVELYLPFFYLRDVPSRASTLIHELDIWHQKKGMTLVGKTQLGTVRAPGCMMVYLWWFYVAGARTTTAMRARARAPSKLDHQ